MRIGLIGLSTPLAFDYEVQASRARADVASSPNPVLDSPFGLMLLYDELWFVCRSLCPENMRTLPFVRFLDEEGELPDLSDFDERGAYRAWTELEAEHSDERTDRPTYPDVMSRLPATWAIKCDNHTHSLDLGSITTAANAGAPDRILLDLEILERLGRKDVELVGNTFGQWWMESVVPTVREQDLAHVMVIDNIPNYLTREGPYHPVINEVREDRYIKDFRRWITETAPTAADDAQTIKSQVEDRLREAQEELFLRSLDRRTYFESTAKTITGIAASFIVPYAGSAAGAIQDLRHARSAKTNRWQGFLVSFARAARNSDRNIG